MYGGFWPNSEIRVVFRRDEIGQRLAGRVLPATTYERDSAVCTLQRFIAYPFASILSPTTGNIHTLRIAV